MEILSSRVIVHPGDLATSRRFYEDVLGLRVYREWSVGVGLLPRWRLPRALVGRVRAGGGGRATLVAAGSRASTASRPPLAGAGVGVRKPTEVMPWGLVELWVEDPDGNELRLVEVPADAPPAESVSAPVAR